MASADNGDPLVNRALASRSRLLLLRVLRQAGGGLGVGDLAARVGLHPSTVRRHLEVLAEAGLLRRYAERTGVRGRPRVLYRVAAPAGGERGDSYRLLATILAEHARHGAHDPAAAGERAGRSWSGRLVAPGQRGVDAREAHERVVSLFAELGFQPELARGDQPGRARMLLHRCPFLELARANPEVVCGVHLGLLRGALAALDAPVRAVALEPFVHPDLCVAHLAGDVG